MIIGRIEFNLGSLTIGLTDIIVAAVCLIALAVFIIFIVRDIKRGGEDIRAERKMEKKERKRAAKLAKKNGEPISDEASDFSSDSDEPTDSEIRPAYVGKETEAAEPKVIVADKTEPPVSEPTIAEVAAPKKAKKEKKAKPVVEKIKPEKRSKKKAESVFISPITVDPLAALLGFDPYAPIEMEVTDTSDAFYDSAQETEDMRTLRERVAASREVEHKLTELAARREKVRTELTKATRYLRDNGAVMATSAAVSERLRSELNTLTANKKKAKANKKDIAEVKRQLEENERTTANLGKQVNAKRQEDRLLRDAFNHLSAEIARAERELSRINADIEELNSVVGAELKQQQKDNRARELMAKYRELRPLLTDVNTLYREIIALDAAITDLRGQKHELKSSLDFALADVKAALGAQESIILSQKVSELNRRMLALDAEEETLLKKKEEKIEEFKIVRRKTNDFLDREKYALEDIIVAEDKVVGELEYEQIKAEYTERKRVAAENFAKAQSKYETLASRKVKFKKKNGEEQKRAYEEENATALAELKRARAESEKANNDVNKVLPSLSASTLVSSGSGVISRERISRESVLGLERDEVATERVRRNLNDRVERIEEEEPERPTTPRYDQRRYEPTPPARPTRPAPNGSTRANDRLPALNLREELASLMNRLNELERIAQREKERLSTSRPRSLETPASKIQRRKEEVIALRKNLRYIDSPESAKEFRKRLYNFSLSLDEEEQQDNVLSEMIRKTMDEAARLGNSKGRPSGYYRYDD